jgi:hypothetical protein
MIQETVSPKNKPHQGRLHLDLGPGKQANSRLDRPSRGLEGSKIMLSDQVPRRLPHGRKSKWFTDV